MAIQLNSNAKGCKSQMPVFERASFRRMGAATRVRLRCSVPSANHPFGAPQRRRSSDLVDGHTSVAVLKNNFDIIIYAYVIVSTGLLRCIQ